MKKIADVAVPINVNKTFSYFVPENLADKVTIGKRVLVPFSGRNLTGYILGLSDKTGFKDLKEIISVLDDAPLFYSKDLEFFQWLSVYYMTPLAQVIKTALPPGINQQSKKYYTITKTGVENLKDAKGKTADILNLINESGQVSASIIKQSFGSLNTLPLLKRLEKKGLVDSANVISENAFKNSYVKHIIVKKENKGFFNDHISSLPKNAKNKQKICLYLLENEDVPYTELTERFNNVKKILDNLSKLDFIEVSLKEKEPDYKHPFMAYEKKIIFTKEQKEAIEQITAALDSKTYRPFLLHGVTGSGKTEIYIQAAIKAVEQGRGVIMLVPEIALTPNLIRRFKQHFDKIAVMHSSISSKEKYQYYLNILNGEVKVVIGVRSAIFAPFKELGLIIIDEEHVSTYKQDEGFKYNARDVALVRAKQKKSAVILGSATPSIESYYNAASGKYEYLRLTKRVTKASLPKIFVVDMKKEREESERKDIIISKVLMESIKENLEKKTQTMLFLNRRGHSSFIVCYDCGNIETCPNCSISLTYHKTNNNLLCHYCGFKKEVINLCQNCKGSRLKQIGFGTQRVYELIRDFFPAANVFRIDSDTMTKKDSYIDFYKKMDSGEIDIAIGTQMIAKGHDFENVTLVGILNADSGLTIPDFRAEENCFSLITQVSGRAGRGDKPGSVVIQTVNPDNDYINYALDDKMDEFYSKELSLRKELKFPPFSRLINIKITSRIERQGIDAYNKLNDITNKILRYKKHKSISVMGPVKSPIYKIKNNYRWQMLIRSKNSDKLHLFANELLKRLTKEINKNSVKISIDVDPINML